MFSNTMIHQQQYARSRPQSNTMPNNQRTPREKNVLISSLNLHDHYLNHIRLSACRLFEICNFTFRKCVEPAVSCATLQINHPVGSEYVVSSKRQPRRRYD